MAVIPNPTLANIDVPAGQMRPGVTGGITNVRTAFVVGAVAGNVTVQSINTNDVLLSVIAITTTATPAVADRTSEFSITAANTINNTGGTSTANQVVVVTFMDTDYGFPNQAI